MGADEVIPEEFETSVEIFTRVLMKYLVPRDEIERFVSELRSDGYEVLRSVSREFGSLSELEVHLPDVEISTFRVEDGSLLVGQTLAQIELRRKYGVTLLAVRRNSEVLVNPAGDIKLCAGDLLVILGMPDELAKAAELFDSR